MQRIIIKRFRFINKKLWWKGCTCANEQIPRRARKSAFPRIVHFAHCQKFLTCQRLFKRELFFRRNVFYLSLIHCFYIIFSKCKYNVKVKSEVLFFDKLWSIKKLQIPQAA